MGTEFEKLKGDLTLPVESRASLAHALIESLDDVVDDDAESLWMEEIRRRNAEIRAGTAIMKPADQVVSEARELLRCLKSRFTKARTKNANQRHTSSNMPDLHSLKWS